MPLIHTPSPSKKHPHLSIYYKLYSVPLWQEGCAAAWAAGVQQICADLARRRCRAGGSLCTHPTLCPLLHAPTAPCSTSAFRDDPRPKVLLLMGFAASHQAWAPQVADLLNISNGSSGAAAGQQQQQEQEEQASPMVVCVLDNRGVGRSSAPTERRDYRWGWLGCAWRAPASSSPAVLCSPACCLPIVAPSCCRLQHGGHGGRCAAGEGGQWGLGACMPRATCSHCPRLCPPTLLK